MNEAFWSSLQARYDALTEQLISPSLESSQRHLLQKEMSFLSTMLGKHNEIVRLQTQRSDLEHERASVSDPEMIALYDDELTVLDEQLSQENKALDLLMFPPDEKDNRSVFLEIRAGTGGQEAALFVGDLLRMYMMYAQKMRWHVSMASVSETDLGGYREVVLHIEGKYVYGHLKFESGVHRVQRVPSTETQGRVHTSTATVAVLPEAEEVEVSINPNDLRIDVFRAGGAGGQHVNTTDSAVRITHIPTGTVVSCQDERSQHKNKAKALKVLQSRILQAQQEKTQSEMSKQRKELVGTGERSEKVRTYNFPQNRITDHQVELTLKSLDRVMEGELSPIIDALMALEAEDRRKKPFKIS
jgi:peptide chain release factor 1